VDRVAPSPCPAGADYLHARQQLVETRNGSDQVLKQHVWNQASAGYIDDLAQLALNDDPSDPAEQACESLFWSLCDAKYNVLAIISWPCSRATAACANATSTRPTANAPSISP
jgi:hypothetical protein